jgi:PAS domain S-box-containing protein
MFVVLGLVAVREWVTRRTPSSAYMACAFGLLGVVVLAGQFIPNDRTSEVVLWATRLEIVGVVLFPFFLYRFVATLIEIPRPIEVTADVLTAAAAIWSLGLPHLPGPGDRPGWLVFFLLLLATEWLFVSGQVVYRLYQAGTGQPATVRLRMRTLSMGSAGISIGLVLAVTVPESSRVSWVSVATQVLAIASGPLFLLGFAPPRLVRTVWRQGESGSMRTTEASLMEALSPLDVARSLLPQAARLVGTDQAGLVTLEGDVLHAIGLTKSEAADLAERGSRGEVGREVVGERLEVAMRMSTAWLVLRTSPFAPFFGETERELLERVAVLGDLALERVQLLARELEHAEQLAEAQRLARIGSWEWDLDTDKVTWSEQLYRNWGVEPDLYNLEYDDYLERVHPDDRARLRHLVADAIENATGFEIEQRQLRPDGSVMWTHARGRAITDESGRVVKFIGTSQDITSRVEQELVGREQARSIEEQAQLLDLARDAIFVRDPGGKLRYWNKGAERLYGWSAREVLGRNVNELLDTGFPVPFEEVLDHLIAHEHWEGELSHLMRSGDRVVVDSRWALQRDDEGKPTGILELNTDITERKRQEELRDRFIADAAHELRTPLTTLLGFTEVLASSQRLDKEQTALALDAMGRAGRRMSALVNNLLDLSKLSAGRMALELSEVSVKDVVADALDDAPAPDGSRVTTHVADDIWVIGERDRLSQVASNLLTNAYRYGGPNVAITASRDGGEVTLSVSDDGEGVDPKLLPTVFEPFARSIESSQLGGSGLGLAIVRRLTEACGGSVTYTSSPDGGACFNLLLKAVT